MLDTWHLNYHTIALHYLALKLSHHSLALLGQGMHNSCNTDCIQISSAVAYAITLYFASVLERDTVFCSFVHHDIKLGLKKIAKSSVDFLSSEQPAQLTSEKALTSVEEDLRI
jgi:hypothetical protein